MIGKVKMREAESRVIPAALLSYGSLMMFSNRELRAYAKSIGVICGKKKIDTVIELIASGKASICATLGD